MTRVSQLQWSPGAAGPLDENWRLLALCAQADPEAFFPEKGASAREAKRVCRSCEVRAECLDYALRNDERWGVWGGLSERERRRLRPVAAPSGSCSSGHEYTPENTYVPPGGGRQCRTCTRIRQRGYYRQRKAAA